MQDKKPAKTIEEIIERDAGILNKLDSHLGCVVCKDELMDGQCLNDGCSAYDPAFRLTNEDVTEAVAEALKLVGLHDYSDLQKQAKEGVFQSEQAKRVWFATHAFHQEKEK